MEERWLLANPIENAAEIDGEEEEEALSLCDLPINHHNSKTENKIEDEITQKIEIQEEFDFCRNLPKSKSEMCAADDVFFQGQILPLRNSVSSENKTKPEFYSSIYTRSESMEHSSSFSNSSGLISSRSSSTSSGSSIATRQFKTHTKPPRNVFHSHPSPSPRISRFQSNKQQQESRFRKSSVWGIFKQGLLVAPPPEIAFQDLKRNRSRKSVSSDFSSGGGNNKKVEKKNRLSALLGGGGGCKCAVDAVDDTVRRSRSNSKVVVIKRSAFENEVVIQLPRIEVEEEKKVMKKQETKKQLSHHRTFEWLKQLSLEEDSAEPLDLKN